GQDNRPGDILVTLRREEPEPPFYIVVETKGYERSRGGVGRKVINESVSNAIRERKADAAIFVCETRSGLAAEIGDWAEGCCARGAWVACPDENLRVAVRWLVIQNSVERL